MYRSFLAALIALAVAMAPMGSALAAANSWSKAAMHDCHGKKAQDHSCCDKMSKAPDSCGFKCCKLMGMIVSLAITAAPDFLLPETAEAEKPPDHLARPPAPPPRS